MMKCSSPQPIKNYELLIKEVDYELTSMMTFMVEALLSSMYW